MSLKPFYLFDRLPLPNNHTERELDIKLVESMIESHYHSFSSDVEPPSASTTIHENDKNSKIWTLMGVNNKSLISDSQSEIEHFMRLPSASTDKDPLQWWNDNKSAMPSLYRMACDYLSIPAPLVPAEEANSAAKMTFDNRIKLHSCTFKAEMCVRSWMNVLKECNVQMLDNFHISYAELTMNLDDLVAEDEVIDCISHDSQRKIKVCILITWLFFI